VYALVGEPLAFTGAARNQVASVVEAVEVVAADYPDAAVYSPGDIL
jgi:adenylosuccinate lyase